MSFSYPEISHRGRLIQCVALAVESIVLFTESDQIGLYFVVPLTIHLINLYHTAYRCFYNIDGRFELSQAMNLNDPDLKARYAFAFMGSFLLAVIGHFMLREISSVIYHLADYFSIASSGTVLASEVIEILKR